LKWAKQTVGEKGRILLGKKRPELMVANKEETTVNFDKGLS